MMHRLVLIILLSLTIPYHIINGHPVEDEFDEEDEDIIKHFEGLLKSGSGSPPGKPKPNVVDEAEEEPFDTVNPEEPNRETPNAPIDEESEDYPKYSGKPAEKSKTCECKKYYECDVGGSDKGPGPENPTDLLEVDVRWGDSVRSTCDHYLDVCCDSIHENITEIRNPEYEHSICGKRNLEGVGFHAKGAVNQESQFGEFPWMAAIVSRENHEGKNLSVFVCGGSLIHPGVVLTAAHCVKKRRAEDLVVRLGEWDTQTSNEIYPHKDHYVVKMVIHEDFYSGALYNDVALLFLNEETKLAPHIDTVCLPPSNINFDGRRCYASGWGRDSFGKEGNYQVILKKLDLPIVSRDSCESSLKRTRLGRYFKLHESFVCAGGEKGRDTCRGDGGSPLVCNVPGTESYVQYGIVAWGIGCGEDGVPGVYVNVPKFVGWITRKMAEARMNTNYFKLGRKLF